jgi:hypothetical protein
VNFWHELDNWWQKSDKIRTKLRSGGTYPHSTAPRPKNPHRLPLPSPTGTIAPPPRRFGAACPGCSSRCSSLPLPCRQSRYVNETLMPYPTHYFDLAQMNQKICICMLRSGKHLPISSISSLRYLATSSSFSSDLDILKYFFLKCK